MGTQLKPLAHQIGVSNVSYSNEKILSHMGTQLKPPAHQIGVSNVSIQMRKFSLTWVHSKTSSTPDRGFQCSYSNEKILSHMGTQLKPPAHQIGVSNVSIQMKKFSLTWVHS